jgi:hypothetical protein
MSCSVWLEMPDKGSEPHDTAADTFADPSADTIPPDLPAETTDTTDVAGDTALDTASDPDVAGDTALDTASDPDVAGDTALDTASDPDVAGDTALDTASDPDVAGDTASDPDAPPDTVPDTGGDAGDADGDGSTCAWSPAHVERTEDATTDFYYSTADGAAAYEAAFYGSTCASFGFATMQEYIVEVRVPNGVSTLSVQTTGACDLSNDSSLAVVITDAECSPVVATTRCDDCSYEAVLEDHPVTPGERLWLFVESNNISTPVEGHMYIDLH